MKKQQLDDFEIEHGTSDELTNVSPYGFTDKNGEPWETWSSDDSDVEFMARRKRDGLTVSVLKID